MNSIPHLESDLPVDFLNVFPEVPHPGLPAVGLVEAVQGSLGQSDVLRAEASQLLYLRDQVLAGNGQLLLSNVTGLRNVRKNYRPSALVTHPEMLMISILSLRGSGMVSRTLAVQRNSTLDRSTGTSR